MASSSERQTAVLAVRRASRLTRAVQADLVGEDTLTKKDRSPVTVADYGAQAVVSWTLRKAHPEIAIVGEENADELRLDANRGLCEAVVRHVRDVLGDLGPEEILEAIDACSDAGGADGRRWVLDPIDGTKGYLRRGQYAIALGLLEDGLVTLGVLGCPELPAADGRGPNGCLLTAERGAGSRQLSLDGNELEGQAIRATDIDDASQASFCESVEKAHSAHDDHARVAELLGVEAPPFRIDSQCKYGAVARGQASIYLRLPSSKSYREKIWDHAAGAIVVEEAGGRVTDVRGAALDFSLGRTLDRNRGVVVTNGPLQDRVLAAVATVLGT